MRYCSGKQRSIYLLYTGGTIGSVPGPRGLEPADLDRFKDLLSKFSELGEMPQEGISGLNVNDNTDDNINVDYSIDVLDPPLDSTEMEPKNWYQIALKILTAFKENPSLDGAVVLHGTDTMGYTSSALAFLLKGVIKPVVVTGSQIPLSKPRSDALRNFVSSVAISAEGYNEGLTEVTVVFANRIFRGCRVTKVDADNFCGFDTPNYPDLGDNGLSLTFDKSALLKIPKDVVDTAETISSRMAYLQAAIDDELDHFSIIVIHIYPGISASTVENMILNTCPPVRGIVVRSYGAGNVPNRISTYDDETPGHDNDGPLAAAFRKGVVIINATQVLAGRVSIGTYEASANMARISVSGAGMTTEAAVTKLVSLFATPKIFSENPPDWKRDPVKFQENFAVPMLKKSIVGEIGNPNSSL
jgi:L-asparaginase/Glu-tRNA(Gln) amidotransferase subunit D